MESAFASETHANQCDNTNSNQETVKYQYGNFSSKYCGLQPLINLSDVRLTVFLRHAYLFKDKDILDIGCNVGHMTIAVARKLDPKSILGIDIDKNLIARARQNLSNFHRIPASVRSKTNIKMKTDYGLSLNAIPKREKQARKAKVHTRSREREKQDMDRRDYFPLAFPICFGSFPIVKQRFESPTSSPASNTCAKITDQIGIGHPNLYKESPPLHQIAEAQSDINKFPDNVNFRTSNYAVTKETQMISDKQQYDLILCLSLTKWIHLNFGDAGLKMTFRRMFNQLRPGGKLILEAHNWASYKKRKKLTVSF